MIGRRLDPAEIEAYADVVDPGLAVRVRLVTLPVLVPGASGMTLGRLVLVKRSRSDDERLIAHELVHVAQYAAHGFLGFLGHYLRQYVVGLRRHRRHRAAYEAMPFEREARQLAEQWHTTRLGRM